MLRVLCTAESQKIRFSILYIFIYCFLFLSGGFVGCSMPHPTKPPDLDPHFIHFTSLHFTSPFFRTVTFSVDALATNV
jgi:hypothetical protein